MPDIALRLKILREFLNLTRKDFASLLGIDNSQYSKIEQGKLNLTIQHIMELSSNTDIDVNWLLSGKGEMLRIENIIQGDRNPVGNNQGTISGYNIGDNSINVSAPISGSQKIIYPDKTMEIEQSAQDVSCVAEQQPSYLNLKTKLEEKDKEIEILRSKIIRLQEELIDTLKSGK